MLMVVGPRKRATRGSWAPLTATRIFSATSRAWAFVQAGSSTASSSPP